MRREGAGIGEPAPRGDEQTWSPMTPALARMLGLEQMARNYWRHRVRRGVGWLAAGFARMFGTG